MISHIPKQIRRNSPKVVVFSTPTCSYCRTLKSYLQARKVAFKEVDVSKDAAAARDLQRRTGQTGVPVTLFGDKTVVGFDRPRIDALLGL